MKSNQNDKKAHSPQQKDQKIKTQLKDADVENITGGSESISTRSNSDLSAQLRARATSGSFVVQ